MLVIPADVSDRTEGRIDAQTRNEIDGDSDFRLRMQTCVAALRLPVRMSVERVSGCWWAECPDGVESAAMSRPNSWIVVVRCGGSDTKVTEVVCS
jgi:hypothetical protein